MLATILDSLAEAPDWRPAHGTGILPRGVVPMKRAHDGRPRLVLGAHVVRMPAILLLLWRTMSPAAAQDQQLQIENDVWIPLLAASNAFDADGFLAVQSRDLVRVSADSGEVYGLARYETEIRDGFKRARERGIARKSEVRFLVRTAAEDLAYETGYFRSQAALANGETRTRYTQFEFVLRKERGKWRILLDKDTAHAGRITDEAFRAAAAMKSAGSATPR